jgi:hypothetical protein
MVGIPAPAAIDPRQRSRNVTRAWNSRYNCREQLARPAGFLRQSYDEDGRLANVARVPSRDGRASGLQLCF